MPGVTEQMNLETHGLGAQKQGLDSPNSFSAQPGALPSLSPQHWPYPKEAWALRNISELKTQIDVQGHLRASFHNLWRDWRDPAFLLSRS